jgi:uncharacterized protein
MQAFSCMKKLFSLPLRESTSMRQGLSSIAAPQRPWYKEPWPWLLMSLPATAVVAGFFTLYLAYRSNDGLVAEDYYEQGMTINRVLDKQEHAVQMGLTANLLQNGERFVLTVEAARALSFPGQLRLSFLNPARAGQDQLVVFRREGNHYVGVPPHLRNGRWNLKLEDEGGVWQLFAEIRLPLLQAANLKP